MTVPAPAAPGLPGPRDASGQDGRHAERSRCFYRQPKSTLPVEVSANGSPAASRTFPSTGDWSTIETVGVPVPLKAGTNPITFDSGSGYAPDIDRIDVPKSL